jgi:hypothetical protein
MQKDVVKITALSSADTVKRFNMMAPRNDAIWGKNGKYSDSVATVLLPAPETAIPKHFLTIFISSSPGTRMPARALVEYRTSHTIQGDFECLWAR